MRVVIGSDHAGFDMKEQVKAFLADLGHEVVDVGTHNPEPVDYPDYAEETCQSNAKKPLT